MDRVDSRLDVEHQAKQLSTLLSAPTESPLHRRSGITFKALDLITRPSPFRAQYVLLCGNVFPTMFPSAASPS